MSRCKTTGRFATREELTREVWWRWSETGAGQSDIARACRVSTSVVGNILNTREGLADYERSKQAEPAA